MQVSFSPAAGSEGTTVSFTYVLNDGLENSTESSIYISVITAEKAFSEMVLSETVATQISTIF